MVTDSQGQEVELAPTAPRRAKARKMGRGVKWPRYLAPKRRSMDRPHVGHRDGCSCGYSPRPGVGPKARARSRHRNRARRLGKEARP